MLRSSSLLPSGLLLSTFLPRFPSAPFALTQVSTALLFRVQYYRDSDSCQRSPRRQVSPLVSRKLPDIPPPITEVTRTSLCPPVQRVRRVSGFAIGQLARRHSPPNRVRHPADCQFASGCSPPRLTTTQLPSATGSWHPLTRTSTVRFTRLHGRTDHAHRAWISICH